MYVALELVDKGELFDYIHIKRAFSEKICSSLFFQVLKGYNHIRSKGYCHLDLKLENILVDSEWNLRISDFGFAKISRNKNEHYKLNSY